MKYPAVTVHGRFQPPLHINHWNYISRAFELADKVIILITNPNLDESSVGEASHRNKPENNPFTYGQRIQIFESFFDAMGIPRSRYEFRPFVITDERAWDGLPKGVPNLVNTYGGWSDAKLEAFKNHGLEVIHLQLPKVKEISGSIVREIIREEIPPEEKKRKLIEAGYMKEAIPGLFEVLRA